MSFPIIARGKNKSNDYGFDPHEQATATYTGMGADINVHDQWAVESMDPIQDRTREHLGQSDKAIVQYRRLLRQEIEKVASGAKTVHVPRCRACAQHPGSRHHGRHRPDPGLGNLLDGGRCEARRGAPWAAPVPAEIADKVRHLKAV